MTALKIELIGLIDWVDGSDGSMGLDRLDQGEHLYGFQPRAIWS